MAALSRRRSVENDPLLTPKGRTLNDRSGLAKLNSAISGNSGHDAGC
jgi:hypothetical protein